MRKRIIKAKRKNSTVRKPKRKRFLSQKFVRNVLTLLGMCAVLLFIIMVTHKAIRPYLISYGESREIANISREVAAAEKENKALKKDITYLTDKKTKNKAMTAEARKLGWVKNGETAVVIERPQKPEYSTEHFLNSSKNRSLWKKTRDSVIGLFTRKNTSQQ